MKKIETPTQRMHKKVKKAREKINKHGSALQRRALKRLDAQLANAARRPRDEMDQMVFVLLQSPADTTKWLGVGTDGGRAIPMGAFMQKGETPVQAAARQLTALAAVELVAADTLPELVFDVGSEERRASVVRVHAWKGEPEARSGEEPVGWFTKGELMLEGAEALGPNDESDLAQIRALMQQLFSRVEVGEQVVG